MMFDRKTRLLFSGDSLGPYRLYIPMNEAKTYRDSIDRVAAFTRDKHVSWILGAHIEMTTKPGELIPDEAPSHPDEHVLEISYSNLPELQAALHAMGDNLVQQRPPRLRDLSLSRHASSSPSRRRRNSSDLSIPLTPSVVIVSALSGTPVASFGYQRLVYETIGLLHRRQHRVLRRVMRYQLGRHSRSAALRCIISAKFARSSC